MKPQLRQLIEASLGFGDYIFIESVLYLIYQRFLLSISFDGSCGQCLDLRESKEAGHKLWSCGHCPRLQVFLSSSW